MNIQISTYLKWPKQMVTCIYHQNIPNLKIYKNKIWSMLLIWNSFHDIQFKDSFLNIHENASKKSNGTLAKWPRYMLNEMLGRFI